MPNSSRNWSWALLALMSLLGAWVPAYAVPITAGHLSVENSDGAVRLVRGGGGRGGGYYGGGRGGGYGGGYGGTGRGGSYGGGGRGSGYGGYGGGSSPGYRPSAPTRNYGSGVIGSRPVLTTRPSWQQSPSSRQIIVQQKSWQQIAPQNFLSNNQRRVDFSKSQQIYFSKFYNSTGLSGGSVFIHNRALPNNNLGTYSLLKRSSDVSSNLRSQNNTIVASVSAAKGLSSSGIAIRQSEYNINGRGNVTIVTPSSRREALNLKFARTGDLNYDINYRGYLQKASTLDVSTRKGAAIFYSGVDPRTNIPNRVFAEKFARDNGGQTLEKGTKGGAWLDQQRLFGRLRDYHAMNVWSTVSKRFASGASGTATAFSKGSREGSIYNTQEKPMLNRNGVEIVEK